MPFVRIQLEISIELYSLLEKARGSIPRSTFIREILEKTLDIVPVSVPESEVKTEDRIPLDQGLKEEDKRLNFSA